jgi:hypothetical protein
MLAFVNDYYLGANKMIDEETKRAMKEAPAGKPCGHSMQSMYFDKRKKRWGCTDCDDEARFKKAVEKALKS